MRKLIFLIGCVWAFNLNAQVLSPEKFIEPNPEPIGNAPLVLWYVAQMKNDSRKGQEYCWADYVLEAGIYAERAYPCYSGPMLRKVDEAH